MIHKESDRSNSIQELLTLLQVTFSIREDSIRIEGRDTFPPFSYDAPNDHRMLMAAALAALRCNGTIEIGNTEAVNKSYPDFWRHLEMLSQSG